MTSEDGPLLEAMRGAAHAVRSVSSSATDELRALAAARDAIELAMCERLDEVEQTKAHVAEDASTVTSWARRELRQDAGRTRRMIRAARTMRDLPSVADSARAGRIGLDHVNRFTVALKHGGREALAPVLASLVIVAEHGEPADLRAAIDQWRGVVDPDDLDAAWIAGMAKADFTLAALPEGWHVTGFLPTDVGAKFKAVLTALSVPREAGDDRSAAQRRIDGLDRLLTRVLADGLPTDGTVRPQIHVTVDAGTLRDALAPRTPSMFQRGEAAVLVGFGPVGPRLLAHLTCGADLIPVLVDRIEPNRPVLDVGRAHRQATAKQRHAVWIQQGGICARDHCRNSIDHVHHRERWSDGGVTDLDNLVGLCTACHRHVHRHDPPLARAG